MVYDMGLLAILLVAVPMVGIPICLLGANVMGVLKLIVVGSKTGSIVTPVPNRRTASPLFSLYNVTTLRLSTPVNKQINDPVIEADPLINCGGVIVFVRVTIVPLTDDGTTDGLVNGMTMPSG